jgi:F-type H+-transporting ATPase subunit delta
VSENPAASLPVAGDQAILAHRYVGALCDLAAKDGVTDALVTDMLSLRRLWEESPEWRFVASDPRLSIDSVSGAAAEVAKITGVNPLTSNFLAVVAQNRRLSLLPLLIENFLEEVRARAGELHADVRSARPLTETQREQLTALLAAATGGKVRLSAACDISIIGGLTVKIGSQFVDASVKTKLDHLERSLRGAA